MEKGVRARNLTLAAPVMWCLLCLPACDDAPPKPSKDERSAATVIDAVLQRCHGHRRGSFSRVLLDLSPDGAGMIDRISLDLPVRMRIDRPDGSHVVIDSDQAIAWASGVAPHTIAGERLTQLVALRDLIGMAMLQPLARATHSERLDVNRVALRDGEDRPHELVYDPDADVPVSLSGPAGQVRFVAFLENGRLRVPRVVELDSLGRRTLHIVETGWRFDEAVFSAPIASDRPPDIVIGGTGGTSIPKIVDIEGCSWLLVPDPGDWEQRVAICESAGERLGPRGYTNAGDPLLVEEAGRRWFVVPFRAGREDPEPVQTRPGEQLREVPAHRCVSVHPDDGEWEQRLAAGRDAVDGFVQEHSLVASGPVRVMLNLLPMPGNDIVAALRIAPLQIAVPIAP